MEQPRMMAKLVITVSILYYLFSTIHAICFLPKESGRACDNPKENRWYFNENKFQCLAFTFLGCGGNGNNFRSLRECERSCLPTDGPACYGAVFASPATQSPEPEQQQPARCFETGCPEGFECRRGPFFTECCNKTVENWFSESHKKVCKNGKDAYLIGDHIVTGDSCNDFLCPSGFTCETTNPLFAKCCADS